MAKKPAPKTKKTTSQTKTAKPVSPAKTKSTSKGKPPASKTIPAKKAKAKRKIIEKNNISPPALILDPRTPEEQFLDLKKDVENTGKSAKGRAAYLKFLSGKRLPRSQAIEAFCYICCGYFSDGRFDCEAFTCPLYPYFPNKDTPNTES